jgi:hypothetical protein
MEREFDYETITLRDIEKNSHLIFICDADSKKVKVEREEK